MIDVLHPGGGRNTAIDGTNREAALREHVRKSVNLTMVSAEYKLATTIATLHHCIDNSRQLCGRNRGTLYFTITSVLLVELNVRIHQSRTDTSLTTANQSRQCIRSQEGRSASHTVANMTTKRKLRMQLLSKVHLKVVLPFNIHDSLRELGKLYPNLGLSATQNPFPNQQVESGTGTGVELTHRRTGEAKQQPVGIQILLSVVDRRTSDHPGDSGAQSLDPLKEGVLVANVVCLIEDNAIPVKLVERGERLHVVISRFVHARFGAHLERCSEHVIGSDDDGCLGKDVLTKSMT